MKGMWVVNVRPCQCDEELCALDGSSMLSQVRCYRWSFAVSRGRWSWTQTLELLQQFHRFRMETSGLVSLILHSSMQFVRNLVDEERLSLFVLSPRWVWSLDKSYADLEALNIDTSQERPLEHRQETYHSAFGVEEAGQKVNCCKKLYSAGTWQCRFR